MSLLLNRRCCNQAAALVARSLAPRVASFSTATPALAAGAGYASSRAQRKASAAEAAAPTKRWGMRPPRPMPRLPRNTNMPELALPVWDAATISEDDVGDVIELPSALVRTSDLPYMLKQNLDVLYKPALMLRKGTLDLIAEVKADGKKEKADRVLVLDGVTGIGKTASLLQTVGHFQSDGWIVLIRLAVLREITIARKLTSTSLASVFSWINGTEPFEYVEKLGRYEQPELVAKLLKRFGDMNAGILSKLMASSVERTLADIVADGVKNPTEAQKAFESVLEELRATSNERPPVLIAIDQVNAMYTMTHYHDTESKPLLANRFSVIDVFHKILSKRIELPNSAIVCALDRCMKKLQSPLLDYMVISSPTISTPAPDHRPPPSTAVATTANRTLELASIDPLGVLLPEETFPASYDPTAQLVDVHPKGIVRFEIFSMGLIETASLLKFYEQAKLLHNVQLTRPFVEKQEATSLNTFPLPNLPLEEAIFFLATNSILVTACMAFDRCVAISRTLDIPSPTPISPSHLPVQWSSVATMWRAFIVPDQMGFEGGDDESPQARLAHVAKALAVLSRASRSFAAASLLLPWDLRMDLGILYAFCRVGDDLVDEDGDEASQGVRIERLELLRRTVDAVYADPLRPAFSRTAVRALFGSKQDSKPAAQPTSTGQLTPEQQTELCAVASALTDLAQIVPRRCWDELLSGYALDIGAKGGGGGPRMDTVADLIDYGERVAGSVGEMCTRVVLARCGCPPSDAAAAAVVSSARRMGVALQLVNVARDAVQDARDLGRCYLPRELFHDSDAWIVDALVAGRVAAGPDCASGWVRPVAIRDTVLALTDLAEQIHAEAIVGIAALKSAPARAGLRAACAVYGGIGDAVKDMDDEEVARGARARLGVGRMVWIALRAIYGAW
ncbi:Squalene/phytoene synthase-domain-containing protein [Blyttiomyces helicus]|uniref:15-cis-phytoene synthase n=1 Tax=Blyttiomyces helicus TaxID=388810 RepID=A0A4P9WJB3_9FUNG|nr:Squalene/phytoene synthase-domain-containing protein [Blyttiomyces helicus]|eukprot:RKO92452.1 Squalene/phytoene synthase-domain-containing protein [Blyttiomyces helicus]